MTPRPFISPLFVFHYKGTVPMFCYYADDMQIGVGVYD